MSRSVYFGQKVKSEASLYEDLIIEAIKMYGFDVFYMPRAIKSLDVILGEDTESQFNAAFDIEMYIASVDSYEGDGVLMSKFGLEIRNQIKLIVSKKRWDTSVGVWKRGFLNLRPAEGDLIYVPSVKGLFEIKYVDLESPFHQLNNLPVYKMTCELFEYRGEDMNTGVQEVDNIQVEKSLASSYRANFGYSAGSAKFVIDEPVNLLYPDNSTGTAKITGISLDSTTSILTGTFSALRFTDGVVHTLIPGVVITGTSSGGIGTISKVITLTDGDFALSDGDTSIENNAIETRADAVIDFTEVNPFGEVNDAN